METRMPPNMDHDFALILSGVPDLNEDVANALYEAGCDDATLSLQRGAVLLDFCRQASSLKVAIVSAIQDVQKNRLGIDVVRIDSCEYVNQSEIADKVAVSRQCINQYINGTRGPGGFPPPTCHITDAQPLWTWCEVADWLQRNAMIDHQQLVAAQDIRIINSILDCRNSYYRDRREFAAVLNDLCHVDLSKCITSS